MGELIEDAAFSEWEAENGFAAADGVDSVLAAVFYCVWWLACGDGLDAAESRRFLWDSRVTAPRRETEGAVLKKNEEDVREGQRRFFEGLKRWAAGER